MSNIILIGFMGSGKTTFGTWIAKEKDLKLCDTDEYIEKTQGIKIKEIFSQQGESAFRQMETNALIELKDNLDNAVISVGGGLPLRMENRQLMKKLGIVVYLRTSQDELVRRLKGDTDRPLLAGDNLEEKIRTLISQRQDIYLEVADLILDTDKLSFEEMYNKIKKFKDKKGE